MKMNIFKKTIIIIILNLIFLVKLFAENSVTIFTGYQTAPHSNVDGVEKRNGAEDDFSFNFTAGWKGNSFSMPPYYGIRWTNWEGENGWEIEFNHTKVYADEQTMINSGFNILQFTDGLNNLTVNRTHKFNGSNFFFKKFFKFVYIGYGAGIIIPHVEVQTSEESSFTYGYQFGGPTVGLNFGLVVPYLERIDIISEYRFTASLLDIDLDQGGNLKSRIFTNALNIGIRYRY